MGFVKGALGADRPSLARRAAAVLRLCFLGLAGSGFAPMAAGVPYHLENPGDGVIGQPFYVTTRSEDTLLDIARKYGLGYDEMKQANAGVDMWVPGAGKQVLVPTMFVLPDAPRRGLVLNLAEKRMYFYPPTGEVQTYSISVGREGWSTPLGTFHIVRKVKDPVWYPTAAVRAEHLRDGRPLLPKAVPAGPDNPLGAYALRLSIPEYLIHGTNQPWGLGMEVSHGCIRMQPEDIEKLFPQVDLTTPVVILNQPYLVGWRGGELYLEVHAKPGQGAPAPTEVIPGAVANVPGVRVDWAEVGRTLQENTGLPHLVGVRGKAGDAAHLDQVF
jgi:L,D-transpeptidase ErfK/SrfK